LRHVIFGSLLLRLYDPDGGAITIAGTDLRALRGADGRARWGAVPQDPFVFVGSVRASRPGRPGCRRRGHGPRT
jgi:ABC-type multidrug transport system fused ATPase/permease subunit